VTIVKLAVAGLLAERRIFRYSLGLTPFSFNKLIGQDGQFIVTIL
jgi:hypothetical protein